MPAQDSNVAAERAQQSRKDEAQQLHEKIVKIVDDKDLLRSVFGEVGEKLSKPVSIRANLSRKIAELQAQLSAQVNEVLHNPRFRRLEASWRGLNRLVNNTDHSMQLQVEVIDATEQSVLEDLGSLSTELKPLDRTSLHYYIYRRALGTRGGHPYGAIIADFEIGPDEDSMSVVWQMAKLAEKAHAPFITAASASMFRMEEFSDLNLVTADLRATQYNDEQVNFNRWNTFRDEDCASYVGLLLPRVLMRAPHPSEEIRGENNLLCWGSPVYIYAEILNRAFADYGWCSAIRGPDATVGDLPIYQLPGGDPATQAGPTDIVLDDSVEYQFDRLGFIAFCKELHSTRAVFPGGHSAKNVGTYSKASAQASAELSARLPNVFARSRFAHAIKAMCRDRIGDFMSAQDLEKYLNDWLFQYKLDNAEGATKEQKAKRPLVNYNVTVKEVAGYPGVYDADIQLMLHHQVEEIGVTMSLVAEISPATDSAD